MDKLTVGIFIDSSLNQQSGGSFSYCSALIESIRHFDFGPSLNFRFIGSPELGAEGGERTLVLDPFRHIAKSVRYKQQLNRKIIGPVKNILKPLSQLHEKFQSSFNTLYARSVEAELVRNKIDLIYYLYPQVHTLNYPFVTTHWDIGHRSMFSFPEVAMNNTLAERKNYFQNTVEKAFAVFCESDAGREELIHFTNINEERVFIVPMFPGSVASLDLTPADQLDCLKDYGVSSKNYFFYPAQFWSHKNHYNLVLAFQKLKQNNPGIRLVLTGADKGNKDYIKKVVHDLGLTDSVIMPGFVPNEVVYCLYKHALALVMPTFLGPTNMPLLEAEALGCPVICSNLKGHWEMLGANACYIEPGDPESIYQGMKAHLTFVQREPQVNNVFNITNALKQIEANFLALKSRRKTFGYDFNQF